MIPVRGQVFETQAAIARAFGVTKQAVHYAIKRGSLDTLGLNSPAGVPMACTIRGRRFPSQQAAADFYGVHRSTIARWLNQEHGSAP